MKDAAKAAANKQARGAKKQAHLQAILDRYVQSFRDAGGEGTDSIVHRVHNAVDQVLDRDRARDRSSRDIRCGKGCNHCCRGPVDVFPHEAAVLVKVAHAKGIAFDRAHLERQARYSIETWRDQPATDKACVFLGEDGSCKVYDARPNACRKLFVVTVPEFCDADEHAPEAVGRWISWEAEVLASAALEVFGTALMPTALLDVLNDQAEAQR